MASSRRLRVSRPPAQRQGRASPLSILVVGILLIMAMSLGYYRGLHSSNTKPCRTTAIAIDSVKLGGGHVASVAGEPRERRVDTYAEDEEEIALREDVTWSGFPEPLTIDTAEMCNNELMIRPKLRGRLSSDTLVCDSDPSCRACYPDRINDTNRLLDIFHGAEYTN